MESKLCHCRSCFSCCCDKYLTIGRKKGEGGGSRRKKKRRVGGRVYFGSQFRGTQSIFAGRQQHPVEWAKGESKSAFISLPLTSMNCCVARWLPLLSSPSLATSSFPHRFRLLFILSANPTYPFSALLLAIQLFFRPSGVLDKESQLYRDKQVQQESETEEGREGLLWLTVRGTQREHEVVVTLHSLLGSRERRRLAHPLPCPRPQDAAAYIQDGSCHLT